MPKDIEQIVRNMVAEYNQDIPWSSEELLQRLSWIVGFSIGKYIKDHE